MAHEYVPPTAGTAPRVAAAKRDDVDVAEVVELVKQYALQETVGPIRGAGRWLGFGTAGAVLLGAGGLLVVLGVLRLFQTEFGDTFAGRWMGLLPYVVALFVCLAVIGVAVSRIGASSLHRT